MLKQKYKIMAVAHGVKFGYSYATDVLVAIKKAQSIMDGNNGRATDAHHVDIEHKNPATHGRDAEWRRFIVVGKDAITQVAHRFNPLCKSDRSWLAMQVYLGIKRSGYGITGGVAHLMAKVLDDNWRVLESSMLKVAIDGLSDHQIAELAALFIKDSSRDSWMQ